ncbi:OmpA family protein [Fodinicurvata sp. EGI_FJ10296]|uniref:OmpA family protein n=1 Tax=Fodinicurvata sp. EGI_FJ10296 TaxID=3231908 RepID=UPI003455485C
MLQTPSEEMHVFTEDDLVRHGLLDVPTPTLDASSFLMSCESSCRPESGGQMCIAYCGCVLTDLQETEFWLNDEVSEAEVMASSEFLGIIQACQRDAIEQNEDSSPPGAGRLAIGAEAAFNWIFVPMEGDPPVSSEFTLTGSVAASDFKSGCWGRIDPSRPDFVVEVENEGDPLTIRVRSDADTTLMVVTPSGAIACDDKTYGRDPEISYSAAEAGEYDVWVGSWGASGRRSATLTVSREPVAEIGDMLSPSNDFDWPDENTVPDDTFSGVETMAEIWEVLVADLEIFGTYLTAESVVPAGIDGLEITDLSINDPELDEPITVPSVKVHAFDIDNVRYGLEPTYFDIEMIDIDYMELVQIVAMEMGVPLADMETDVATVSASIMPMMDDTQIRLHFEIPNSLTLNYLAIVRGEPAGLDALGHASVETVSFSIVDQGFVREFVDAQSMHFGLSRDDLLDVLDEGTTDANFLVTQDDPRGSVFLALRELLAQSDTGGTFTLTASPDPPIPFSDRRWSIFDVDVTEIEVLGLNANYTPKDWIEGERFALPRQVLEDAADLPGDAPNALHDLAQRAVAGNADAQHDLATAFALGEDISQNLERAVFWYQQSADAGIPNAIYNLGILTRDGLGRDASAEAAVKLFRRAAQRHHPDAQLALGRMILVGRGAERDPVQAARWFQAASAGGNPSGALELGRLFEAGLEGSVDRTAAAEWYRMAAEAGNEEAQAALDRLVEQTPVEQPPSIFIDDDLMRYRLMDLPAPGLAMRRVISERLEGEGQSPPRLVVTGELVNDSDYVQPIPLLVATLFDNADRALFEWSFDVDRERLESGESIRFATALDDLDVSATRLEITVAAENEIDIVRRALSAAQTEVDTLERSLRLTEENRERLMAELTAARDRTQGLAESLSSEQERRVLAQRQLEEREIRIEELTARLSATQGLLDDQLELRRDAENRVAVLDQEILDLRSQLDRVESLLAASEEQVGDQNLEIAQLEGRLNQALLREVEELTQYRSEFFGRLRQVLGGREDIRIVGDRFIFQSEVLFPTGSATLQQGGQQQLAELANELLTVADQFPPDVDWILRVDGHTDAVPISTPEFQSNWELSTARALEVVQFLANQGIPEDRLAAAGFGEHQPIAEGTSPEALARNRRIELQLDRAAGGSDAGVVDAHDPDTPTDDLLGTHNPAGALH